MLGTGAVTRSARKRSNGLMNTLLVWNIRGIENPESVSRVRLLSKMNKCPVVVILEPMIAAKKLPNIARRLRFEGYASNNNDKALALCGKGLSDMKNPSIIGFFYGK